MILFGNSFPLSLVRRRVVIEPASLDTLRDRLRSEGFLSFWGHDDTRPQVVELLGIDPEPLADRPAFVLNAEGLPELNGRVFSEVWVLSPDAMPGHRHAAGRPLEASAIAGWTALRITF